MRTVAMAVRERLAAAAGRGSLRTVSRGSRWRVRRSGWRTVSYGGWRWLIAAVGKRSAAAGRRSAATAVNAPVDKAERGGGVDGNPAKWQAFLWVR